MSSVDVGPGEADRREAGEVAARHGGGLKWECAVKRRASAAQARGRAGESVSARCDSLSWRRRIGFEAIEQRRREADLGRRARCRARAAPAAPRRAPPDLAAFVPLPASRPSVSARICAHSALREPPPTSDSPRDPVAPPATQRILAVGEARRPRPPAPRAPAAARVVSWLSPKNTPLARGIVVRRALARQVGQEDRALVLAGDSAPRLGEQRFAVGVRSARAARSGSWRPTACTLIWCQVPGRQWQNACTVELGCGRESRHWRRRSTPEVPSDRKAVARRRRRRCRPRWRRCRRAAGDDCRGGEAQSSAATSARSVPPASLPSTRRGICVASSPVAASSASDQRRAADVEPQRAGSVGHVGHGLAGQLQPHVVLGQQHAPDARRRPRARARAPTAAWAR